MPESRIDDLNPEQVRAATAGEGPVLTIAGGRHGQDQNSRVTGGLLVSQGIDSGRIMLLTLRAEPRTRCYAGPGEPWVSPEKRADGASVASLPIFGTRSHSTTLLPDAIRNSIG